MNAQSGEGKLGTIIMLALLAAVGMACWNVIPVYFANSSFTDKMTEMARRPRHNNGDEEIMRQLEKEARRLKIEDYINTRTCLEALQRVPGKPDATKLTDALAKLYRLDLGGYVVSFAGARETGSDWVEVGVRSRAGYYLN